MSKEYLEAFNRIALHAEYDNDGSYDCLNFEDDCKLVDEALQHLEAIENAEPSKALKCLERIDNTLCLNNNKGKLEFDIDTEEHTDCDSIINMTEDLEIIKQALLQAQKDKAKIEKLKHDNAILHIQLDTFKKIAFKKEEE